MDTQPAIIDVDSTSIQTEVLERSRSVPVLVDFWATWCAPCKTLGPLLEKLAKELAGRFVLARVDIDRAPELAEAFRIQSVPSVVLVRDGQPVDGFVGALGEKELREFLAPHLGQAPAAANAVEDARALAEAGKAAEGIDLLRAHLREASDDAPARVVLAELLIGEERAGEARKVVERLTDEQAATPEARAVLARLDLLEGAGDLELLERAVADAPDDVGALVAYGQALVAAGRNEPGLEQLFEAALLDLHHDEDAPRKALLAVFQALGPTDPLTLEYQQRLSVLLCT
jgi:putative thioredoxin